MKIPNENKTFRVNRFTGDVLWNIASLGFLAIGGLMMNGIIIKFRGADALGVFNQVYAIYIVLSQIGVGGIQHSVLKHISYNQDNRKLCAESTAAALILILGITIPLSLAGIFLAKPISLLLDSPDVFQGLLLVFPGIIFFSANKVLINVLNGLRQMRTYAIFRALRFIFIPGFIIGLILLEKGSGMLPLSLTLSELTLFLVLLIYIYISVLPLQIPHNLGNYIRMHFSYGSRGVMSGVFIELNTRIDVIMLGIFLSDYWVGIYSFAAILAEGFAQIPMAVRYNVDPLLGEYFSTNQHEKIPQLLRQIRKVLIPIMSGLGIVSILLYPLIYQLLAGTDGMVQSWIVYAIFATVHVVMSGFSPFRGLLLLGDKPGLYTIIIISSTLLNILLNSLLIGRLNIYGAAVGSGSSIILELFLIVLFSRRYLKIKV